MGYLKPLCLLLIIAIPTSYAEMTQGEIEGWARFNRPMTAAAIAAGNEKRLIILNGREIEGAVRVDSFGAVYKCQDRGCGLTLRNAPVIGLTK